VERGGAALVVAHLDLAIDVHMRRLDLGP